MTDLLTLVAGFASILPLAASVGGMEAGAVATRYGGIMVWELWGNSGVLCSIRDQTTIGEWSDIDRYDVINLQLRYENGVQIRPINSGYQYLTKVVEPGLESRLFGIAQLNESGKWFANNSQIPPLGQACLNDGVEAAVKVIESTHLKLRGTPATAKLGGDGG